MNCPICGKPIDSHVNFEANVCATALDQRSDLFRMKISECDATARVLRRRAERVRQESFT